MDFVGIGVIQSLSFIEVFRNSQEFNDIWWEWLQNAGIHSILRFPAENYFIDMSSALAIWNHANFTGIHRKSLKLDDMNQYMNSLDFSTLPFLRIYRGFAAIGPIQQLSFIEIHKNSIDIVRTRWNKMKKFEWFLALECTRILKNRSNSVIECQWIHTNLQEPSESRWTVMQNAGIHNISSYRNPLEPIKSS
jgi:hypothetical protein